MATGDGRGLHRLHPFTVVSIFKIREIIIDAIPQDLKYAMAAGIGIFISFVGLQGGGIVIADPASIISIGSFKVPTTWLTIFGTLVTALLMARKSPAPSSMASSSPRLPVL